MSPVGTMLKQWRGHRHVSQLDLANEAGVSQRHLSFVETGRAKPSKELVLHLASVLEVPLRERNALLHAAGFAPVWRETDLDDPAMAPVARAIDLMLQGHEPYPAAVVDRWWDVQRANVGATALMAKLVNPTSPAVADGLNLMRVTVHPEGLRSSIVNWDAMVGPLLERLHRDAALYPDDARLVALVDELSGYAGLPAHGVNAGAPEVVVPIHVRTDDFEVRMFSTLATIGAAADVTVQELVIELFFPADEASASALRSLS